MTSPTPVVRLVMPDGKRWLRLHIATVRQQLDIADMPPIDATDSKALQQRYEEWLAFLEAALDESSWAGRVGDGIGLSELKETLEHWLQMTEDDAFPLAPESGSATSSAGQLSEAPTADASPSTGPRSRRSSRSRASGRSRPGK